MSPSTLTTFTTLSAVNLRADVSAAPAEIKGDSFQALLDIGTDENAPDNNPPRLVKNNKDDDRKEIIAAPVDVATPALPEPAQLQADDGDHDAHVRAYNENAQRTRIADKEESDKPAAPLAAKDSDTHPAAPAQTKETATEKSIGAAKAVTNTPDILPVPVQTADISLAQPADIPSEQTALVDDLHNHIGVLSQALEMLATLSGNPQPVNNARVKIDTVVVQAASLTVAGKVAHPIAGLDTSAGTEIKGDYSPKLALSDILSQITRLNNILDNAKGSESVPNVMPAFRALINDLRALSQYLREHPEAAAEWGDEKTNAILATRALIREYKSLVAADDDGADPIAVKPTIVTKIISDPVLRTVAVSPVTPSIDTTPIQPNLTPAAAIAAAATAQASADTQTNTGGNQNGNNPLPMQISSVREANQTQAAPTANAPDFARLLQQAKMPVMEQVMVHIKLHDGASKIEIKLEPEALGKVELKMNTDANGKTVVSVTADNKGTLDLLQRDARGLERALADAGLKTDSGSLSFNLRGEQGQNQNASLTSPYAIPGSDEKESSTASALSRSYVVNLSQGLDIVI